MKNIYKSNLPTTESSISSSDAYADNPVDQSTGGEVLEFGKTEKQLQAKRKALGLIERIQFDRQTNKAVREEMGTIAVNLLAAQREAIVYQISLGLDDQKKRAFTEYMRQGGKVERELAHLSTAYEHDLIDFTLDMGMRALEAKKTRLERMSKAFQAGRISQQDFEKEQARIEALVTLKVENLDAKIEMLLRNHATQITRTLKLYSERVVGGEVA